MNITCVHNYYQRRGGEDLTFERESRFLESHGHRVARFSCHNDDLRGQSRIKMAANTVWNRRQYRALRAFLRDNRAEVAHFHNTFPMISPAAYYAAADESVPVVQTLQNYRLLCPNAQFLRDGRVCEDCLGKWVAWPGVAHRCYRGSTGASGVVTAMLSAHRLLSTWNKVSLFIVVDEFAKRKFVQGGLPADRIFVKPNFLDPDPGPGGGRGGYALFVGRLDVEKGIDTLLSAFRKLGGGLPLKIVGDGPLAPRVEAAARELDGVEWLGFRPPSEVLGLVGDAALSLVPSIWYEGQPLTIVESYARGTPVIASEIGALATLIDDGKTGLLFRPGDADDLAAKLKWVLTHPAELARLRAGAREKYETRYTAEQNYSLFMEAYALATRGRPNSRVTSRHLGYGNDS